MSADQFIKSKWPKKPLVVHGLAESVKDLTSIPFLSSLHSLFEFWSDKVQVHLPDVSDESSSIEVSSKDAIKLFSNKMGLLFNNVHEHSPVIKNWLCEIGKDLGLPASTIARAMLYATPDGKGTAPHFDQNVNFVLQIFGEKKWKLAANKNVENPTERFVMGSKMDLELSSYVKGEMPLKMPTDCEEIVLKPGSMLFVPRGYWHSTEANGEALALNFTFSQPTWMDLFLTALRSRLTLSAEWRELADGVNSENLEIQAEAEENLNRLLLSLVEDLPNWQAIDILESTEG